MECPYKGLNCECGGEVALRHRNTAFHYEELWKEYWRDRL